MVKSGRTKRKPSPFDLTSAQGLKQIIVKIGGLRRRAQKAMIGRTVRTFQGDLHRCRTLAQQANILGKKRRFVGPRHEHALAKLRPMEIMAENMEKTWSAIETEEDETMRLLYTGELVNRSETLERIGGLDR